MRLRHPAGHTHPRLPPPLATLALRHHPECRVRITHSPVHLLTRTRARASAGRYHKQTGIAFSSIYPGCIAESPLFREKRPWFRKYFPIFMKYITGGYVGEEEAGMRLFQVAHDPRCSKSGVYWSWNGGPREGRGEEALEKDGQILGGGGAGGGWDSIYENDQSDKVLNKDTAAVRPSPTLSRPPPQAARLPDAPLATPACC